jgi:hypothetical protein
MTWTPPDALVERVAKAVRCDQFARTRRLSSFDENVPPTSNEMDNARAALAATPLAELVEALEVAYLQINYLHDKFQHTGSGAAALQKIAAAIARAKGETP